ncbi:hypothetical protein AX17_002527 [Amanita inopinata Kibby_2008]|nr:hypothetical protein AX17_002527 [Amanita inopinata Kibby_2008]
MRPSLLGPDKVQTLDDLTIVSTVTNTGDEALCLLPGPNTPFCPLPTDKFQIVREGNKKEPSFVGVRAKFVPDAAVAGDSCTTLQPGEFIDNAHDMTEMYDFVSLGKGTYTLSPTSTSFLVVTQGPDNDAQITRLEADVVESHVVKVLGITRSKQVSSLGSTDGGVVDNVSSDGAKKPSFKGCSSSQQQEIGLAAVEAQNYLQMHQNEVSAPTRRFKTWFGQHPNQQRYSIVNSHFSSIAGNDFLSFRYDCTCSAMSMVYAYVNPNEYGAVYLCGAFWSAPLTGTDSKAGTLIHEASHFTRNGGTGDYAYGQRPAIQLAREMADEAVMNADSHEYFAENNPGLPYGDS